MKIYDIMLFLGLGIGLIAGAGSKSNQGIFAGIFLLICVLIVFLTRIFAKKKQTKTGDDK